MSPTTSTSTERRTLGSEKPAKSHEVVVSDCRGYKYIKMFGIQENALLRVGDS